MASVTFEHLSKRYGDLAAVDDLSLEIEDGEFVALVGPSGCGKSTTLRLLAGLEEFTDGVIRIGDQVVNNVPAKDRDIAMVFQSYALYPHMSVYDNMGFALSLRKVSKDEIRRRITNAAQILGIEELLDRKPSQLSGGQRQRVALGRAIVRDPAVFLLDEPLSNLDAKLRVQTRAEISKLHRRLETTFIYVTHDQVEAMTMATRIAVMDAGRLHQVGAPQYLYDHPLNTFVAGFIGSPSMNLFEADVVGDGDAIRLQAKGVDLPAPERLRGFLDNLDGSRVVVGVRPEDLHDAAFQPSDIVSSEVQVDVDVTELLGNEVLVHARVGEVDLLARVDPRTTCCPGETSALAVDLGSVHLFDPASGVTLDRKA